MSNVEEQELIIEGIDEKEEEEKYQEYVKSLEKGAEKDD